MRLLRAPSGVGRHEFDASQQGKKEMKSCREKKIQGMYEP